MRAITVLGVGHQENWCQADFRVSGTTPNLGIKCQDVENRRDINFFDSQPPNLVCLKFGQSNVSPAPKYGVQTVKTPLTASKTVGCAKPNLSVILIGPII